MKTRSGFVSNSSSSSFVYILLKDQYEELLKNVDEYQKAVLKELGHEEKQIFGQEAIVISGMNGNNSSFEYMNIDVYSDLTDEEFREKYEYERYASEAFENIPWPKGTFSTFFDC